jgi:outer membrane protein OmpA-like peptidoglycan-associated protein/outer membrane protein W
MKTRVRAVFAGAALLLAAGTVASAAPGDAGSWEFGPYVGWAFLDKYDVLKPKNDFIAGGRLGFFITQNLSLEASYQVMGTETNTSTGQRDFDLNSGRLNALWNFREGKVFRPFVTVGGNYDSVDVNDLGTSNDIGGNAGGGARWILSDNAGLRLDARYVYHNLDVPELPNEHQDNFELTAGLSIMLGGGPPKDSDGDGVRDSKDKCPDTPRGAIVDERGCPRDSDGDGVFDGIDTCPDTPKGCPVDARGCPIDSDGDGVIDCMDKCADTPRGARVDVNGCPTDADGDGVWDGIDTCPDTPKGCPVDAKGCPLDSDGDGVMDCRDKCASTPRGTPVDADGCPVKAVAPVFPEGKTALVLEGVNFATDKWDVTEESKATLDRVADSLKGNPGTKVEVQGHTDSTGADKHNMDLSEKRAQSVRDYLISKGVPESQLTSKGYGETKPVGDNKTKDGRSQNRRTELDKVE